MSNLWIPEGPVFDYPFDKDFYQDYQIFVKPIDYPMSQRKIDALL